MDSEGSMNYYGRKLGKRIIFREIGEESPFGAWIQAPRFRSKCRFNRSKSESEGLKQGVRGLPHNSI